MRSKVSIVQGVGINDATTSVYHKGFPNADYAAWSDMLMRCYCETYQKSYPTYKGCSVCAEWLRFSTFRIWYSTNYKEGFELDKDLLVPGNKVYSPDTCRYVPHYINSLLLSSNSRRGEYPLGVSKSYNLYLASCRSSTGKRLTQTFSTVDEAASWYKQTKKRVIKEQAIQAFLDNAIKTDVYLALVRREF
jgi:hypothetical protein